MSAGIGRSRSDDEAEDNSSSSSANSPLETLPGDFKHALAAFRQDWQRELHANVPDNSSVKATNQTAEELLPNNVETRQHLLAESLFRQAVELEQRGKVYDALPLYRRALQIEPDIEYKFYAEQQKLKTTSKEPVLTRESNIEEGSQEQEDVQDLYEKFELDLARGNNGRLLLNSRDAGVISTELHISDLPTEILLYILRWVISAQLDMRSLEQCASVCKGLYLCARDEELWRLACVKVWGVHVGSLDTPHPQLDIEVNETDASPTQRCYSSWRQMFIDRERVHFNGCYISKTSYLRMGENSFQDQFYRPVQLVEYYRYLRFLPDGRVYMMLTAEEPAQAVSKLRPLRVTRSDVLTGQYRLYGNTLSIVLMKRQTAQNQAQFSRKRNVVEEKNYSKYCIEFRIASSSKRKFAQLIWLHYSIVQMRNNVEVVSEFELTPNKYPPLWFSHVRSYHLDTDAPLS